MSVGPKDRNEGAPAALWVVDRFGRVTAASAGLAEMAERTVQELVGRAADGWLTAESARQVEALAAAEGLGSAGVTLELVGRDGAVRTVAGEATPLGGAEGTVFRVAATADDEARRLRDTIGHLESLLENLPHMVFMKDAEHLRFVRFNKAGEELLGISRGELLGRSDRDFFPPAQADFFIAKDRAVLASGEVLTIPEEPIETRKGRRLLRTKKVALRDSDGKPRYLLGISEDITELREAERRVEEHRKMLEHSARLSSLGELAAGIAHEVNTPLAVVSVKAALLERLAKAGASAERIVQEAAAIRQMAARLGTIVQGLRSFGRGDAAPRAERAPVARIVEEVVALCGARVKQHSIELRVDVPPGLALECRPVQVGQVLMNLLNNAFDAVSSADERWVEVSARDAGETVRISVVDSGPGVPEDARARIMQPFFTTKLLSHGTGLGLSISRSIAEAHGGTLALDAAAEHTRFVLELPKVAVEGSSAAGGAQDEGPAPKSE